MLFIQLTGLSGAGKTTIANLTQFELGKQHISTQVIDGDTFRLQFCKDLGFNKADRYENLRRMIVYAFSNCDLYHVTIIAAINPYEDLRRELQDKFNAKTVFINCEINILIERDTKGLYSRALLPAKHPQKLSNLSGINDPFETPICPNLIINTHLETINESTQKMVRFINHILQFG